MKDQKNSQYLKEIIARYLAGTASDAELKFLEQLDTTIDKHQNHYSKMSSEEQQKLKNKIRKHLDQEIKGTTSSVRPILWIRYAAAVLILVSASIGLFYFRNLNTSKHKDNIALTKPIVPTSTITPGTNRASIVLDDGTQYQLSESHAGIVNMDNEISYEDGKTINTSPHASATIVVPAAGQYRVTLSDGTKVWLNSVSSLRYPIQFSGSERRVVLTGEAYFEVEKDASLPFIVESDGQEIKVLGTKFNIAAYKAFPTITTLFEGSVNVSSGAAVQRLSPGQQLQMMDGNMKLNKSNVDLEEVLAWKNGYFKFNENLESIMNKVSRWYDVEVVYNFKPDPEMTFEGKISRSKNIEEIFEIMESTKEIRFEIQGRRVTVMK